jgi:hypothetical protein
MIAGYPLSSPRLNITSGQFGRKDHVVAAATGAVDIAWAPFVLPGRLTLACRAVVPLESWRTHRPWH